MLKRGRPLPTGKPSPERQKKPIDGVHNPAERIRVDQRAPFLTPRPESFNPSLSQPFQAIRRNAFINMIMSIR